MTRSSTSAGAETMRAFSLYGVNQHDRVAECTHFDAASLADAIDRARAQTERFPKVELWVGCDCVWVEARPPAGPGRWLPSWAWPVRRRRSLSH